MVFEEILTSIKGGKEIRENDFNHYALEVFKFQYENNKIYQKLCDRRKIKQNDISYWEEIPAIPASAFKMYEILSVEKEGCKKFSTSGTTDTKKKGVIYKDDLSMQLMDSAVLRAGDMYANFEGDGKKTLLLTPPSRYVPENPMAYDMELMANEYKRDPEFLLAPPPKGFDVQTFITRLKEAEMTGKPIDIWAASFALAIFFDKAKEKGLSFKLPKGSIILDGGGYKGRSREIEKEEFIKLCTEVFGIPDYANVNVLGLTEIPSLLFDNTYINKIKDIDESRYKPNLPWTRTIAVDPETLERVPKGETGLLRYYDLANISTVLAVQTDDIGYEIGNGFEILGRAKGAEARGCSMAIEELIEATESGE